MVSRLEIIGNFTLRGGPDGIQYPLEYLELRGDFIFGDLHAVKMTSERIHVMLKKLEALEDEIDKFRAYFDQILALEKR